MSKQELTIDIKAIDGFSKVFKNMESPLNSFMSQMKNLDQNTNFDKLKLNLDSVSKYFLKLSKDLDNATNNNKKRWADFNKSLFNGFNEITRPFDAINGKLGNVFNSGLFLADDFNTNLNRIANITHIEHDHEKIKALKNDAEEAAKFIGDSTANFSSMMYTAAKNAVTTKQGLIDASLAATTMAKDLQMDSHLAMEGVVNFTHAYGEGEDKFNKYADLLVWMKEKSGSNMDQIIDAMSKAAPVSKNFNIKETELAAMYTQMSLGGIRGGVAATAIKNFFFGTQDPNAILKKANADPEYAEKLKDQGIMETLDSTRLKKWGGAVAKLGLDKNQLYDKQGNLQLFNYLIPKLQEAQQKLTTKDFNQNLRYMFGREGFSGIAKLVSLPKDQNGFSAQKALAEMQEYEGKRMQQFKIYRNSYRGKLDVLSSSMDTFKEKLANSGVLDLAIKLVDKLGNAVIKISDFFKENPAMLKWVAGFGVFLIAGFKFLGFMANLGNAIFAFKKVGEFISLIATTKIGGALIRCGLAVSKFIYKWSMLKFVVSLLSKLGNFLIFAGRALAVFAISNPFTAIIAGSALVAYLVYKNYDLICDVFSSIWEWIKKIFSFGFDSIVYLYKKIKGLILNSDEIKMPDAIDITKTEIQKIEPVQLYIPKSQQEITQLTNKSIIDINFKNAPKDLIVSSSSKGENKPKLNITNMGHQDLAYE